METGVQERPAVNLGRGLRSTVYLEPELYDITMRVVAKRGKSFSGLLRSLLVRELISGGELTAEQIIKLASE